MKVMVCGGAGYIGAHVCKALAAAGHQPITFDNLSAGHRDAVRWGPLVVGDINDPRALAQAFRAHQPDAAMHFAARIEVGEGQQQPLDYWRNNLGGVVCLLEAMRDAGCARLVFSSTAAVYGVPDATPILETARTAPINVYGRTKLAAEGVLEDARAAFGVHYAALRYFNAAGASPDGEIGERHDPETHLIPNALKAAAGIGGPMKLFGQDYDTPDGTCLRDYVHVVDLAAAHVRAAERLVAAEDSFACNIGTGVGASVLEVLTTVGDVVGRPVPYDAHPRRPGDPPILLADPSRAAALLNFRAEKSLRDIVEDAWRFHKPRWGLS